MKNKLLIITSCGQCPNFDNEYYSYRCVCTLLKRDIGFNEDKDEFTIPDDCPLTDAPEQTQESTLNNL